MDYLLDLSDAFTMYLQDQSVEEEETLGHDDAGLPRDQQHAPMKRNRELLLEWRRRMHMADPTYRWRPLLWKRGRSERHTLTMEDALIGFLLLLLDGPDPTYDVWELRLTHRRWLQIVAVMLFRYTRADYAWHHRPEDSKAARDQEPGARLRSEPHEWRSLQRSSFDLAVKVVRELGGPSSSTHC